MAEARLTCSVKACDNYYYKTKDLLYEGYSITYHYFPRRPNICYRWIVACNRGDSFKPAVCFVCSIHFRSDDFIVKSADSIKKKPRRWLKENVVPTKNLTLDEIRSVSYTSINNWKNTNGFSDHQGDLGVIYSSYEVDGNVEQSHSSSDDEYTMIKKKYDKLLKEYEDFKDNSKVEIEKLRSIVEKKDKEFTTKLMKILSEHLSQTEIDLVMFLRKQKKELADSQAIF